MDGIAIIGLAGRFPGARNAAEFWRNLAAGVESISHFVADELEVRDAARLAQDPNYVKARSILEDVDLFDAAFFGIHPHEARQIDPQHRIFLECCWEAIEDGGYDPSNAPGLTGVFAGCSPNSYFLRQIAEGRQYLDDYTSAYQVGFYPTMLGTIADTLATRVAYKLNLKGPALTLLTACSTSLVAVCQACKSLLTYECDMALAGGVSVTLPQRRGYLHQAGGMVSPDGHCRPFDVDAQGTVFGSGAGVVVLKRLEDAVHDRDHIYAVIKGSAVSNDGSAKVGFTAPGVDGQARVIAMAQAVAGVDPRSITYIEAHGTGTPLGDPIEVTALTKVFRESTDERGFCALGTGKANVGHLDVASGVTGLIKTALSLDQRTLLPQINFKTPNPKIELATSPFYINAGLKEWKREGDAPLRAGVSAFGVGGTNAHVVLEEAPDVEASPSSRPYQVLTLSARSTEALESAGTRLAEHLEKNPDLNLADAACTLAAGRAQFDYRRAAVCRTAAEAIRLLRDKKAGGPASEKLSNPAVCFLFPGQGSQQIHMGQEVYNAEPVFRNSVDLCCELFRPHLGVDLREILHPVSDEAEATRKLNATVLAQPAIFTIEYALAQLWMSWGVQPAAMVGHSIGEFVAACLAGVFSLEDAILLVAARGRLMQDLPGGSMLSVRLPQAEILPLLNGKISVAAVNAPALTVVAGPHEAIGALESVLEGRGVAKQHLHTSHAFHSAMMDPMIAPFTEQIRTVKLNAPELPYVSCVTGTWITAEQATDPEYWATHVRRPVRFSDAVSGLRRNPENLLLEVGAGSALQVLSRQHVFPESAKQIVLSSLKDAAQPSEAAVLYAALGRLWSAGVSVEWDKFYAGEKRGRVSLPPYPFERKRYWAEPAEPAAAVTIPLQPELHEPEPQQPEPMIPETVPSGRISRIASKLIAILQDLSGMEAADIQPEATFLELGFDSLFLTQVSQSLQSTFGIKIAFRQLLDQLSSVDALAGFLDQQLPADQMAEPVKPIEKPVESRPSVPAAIPAPSLAGPSGTAPAGVEQLMREQLQIMSQLIQQQLDVLRRVPDSLGGVSVPQPATSTTPAVTPQPAVAQQAEPQKQHFKPFGPYKPVQKAATEGFTPRQETFVKALIERYTKRTAESKRLTQQYRTVLADPRVVSGFRLQWKEMVYPITVNRSRGSRLWDVDGNEYIDLLNGFGPTALGHLPDFIKKAIAKQLDEGMEIGPQTPLAGEVAQLICDVTGVERATFCNTGSEAVMAAMRVARTVTARKKVVMFAGDYHGAFDEVLVKRVGKPEAMKSGPIAPGIPAESLQNVVVLDYGAPESLDLIRKHAHELAAVLVEPVQSRHPALQPREFLQELRKITAESGIALIVDEIVTGFRCHPGGIQKLFDIQADLVTYGKVIGGGMPIGVLAGKAAFMDALDGGMWQYGDASVPEVGVTFFAGTFVRHPLALAAAKAVLEHLKAHGAELQNGLARNAQKLVGRLNQLFERYQVPRRIETFGGVFYFPSDFRFSSLLFYLLREKGIHILEGFPCFISTAHSDADLDQVVKAFGESLAEMQAAGMFDEVAAAASAGVPAPVPTREPVREAPLTEAQLEIWLSAQLSKEASCSYNEAFTLDLRGHLNESALRDSIRAVIARHDALRAIFDAEGTTVHFAPELALDIPTTDLTGQSDDPQAAFDRMVEEDACTPFDLTAGPLIRVRIVKLAAGWHKLFFTSHHIICDGWSTNVILDEVARLYTASCRGAVAPLDPVLAFSEYAVMQKADSAAAQRAEAEAYWLKQFSERPPVLELPADKSRPAVKGFGGATRRRTIGPDLHKKLKKAGAKQGCTLFATLLSGFQALLCRLTGQDDVVVGIPSAAQAFVEGKAFVGHCVNFLPLRAKYAETDSFAQFLSRGNRSLLDAYEHQNYTFGTLVRKLGMPRDPSRLPLIEVQFNLERVGAVLDFDGLKAEMDSCPKQFANFDLFLNIVESADGLVMDCDYNTEVFEAETIDRWLGHYETVLAAVTDDMNRPVRDLPLLTMAERRELITDRNRTDATYPAGCVHELFERQVAQTPDAVALVFGGQSLTYAELNKRAQELGAFLQREGAGPNQLVGICVERSAEMVIAMLGVLKAGAAYIPLDPAYPKDRLNFILDETKVKILLTNERTAVELVGVGARMVCLDAEWERIAREKHQETRVRVTAEDLAYVIYTSGSTGKPKGVEIQHRAVVNFLESMRRQPGIGPDDRLLAVTTLSFDIAGLEIFLPLVSGARLVVADAEATADGTRLAEMMDREAISMMQATPSTWRLLLEADWKPAPGFKMLCGGEALPRDLADQLLATRGVLWNMYGPTETTIWSAVSLVNPGPAPVRIGPPIANTQFYILDKSQQPVPLGVPGELYIGGDGLARGYFNRPELTAEKFSLDPFKGTARSRMYRSGDSVRALTDGSIDFLGRLDNQVKVRGFRIELGEIEAALMQQTEVRDCVVIADGEGGAKKLVAYLAMQDSHECDPSRLRRSLSDLLPAYMVPPVYVVVSAIPRLPNGKVDRRSLPAPQVTAPRARRMPQNEREQQLSSVFREVLRLEEVNTDDNLFELGADSVQVFQIVARANRAGFPFTVQQVLRNPTIELLLAACGRESQSTRKPAVAQPIRRVSREDFRVTNN